MDKLPSNLFDYFRSWLTFRELHKNRRISKRWKQVRDVEKVLTLDQTFFPFANFENITSLSVKEIFGCSLELLKLHDIMIRNVKNLLTWRMHLNMPELVDPMLVEKFASSLPVFPKLTELILSNENGLENEMSSSYIKIMALCPKIKILELHNIYESIILKIENYEFVDIVEL